MSYYYAVREPRCYIIYLIVTAILYREYYYYIYNYIRRRHRRTLRCIMYNILKKMSVSVCKYSNGRLSKNAYVDMYIIIRRFYDDDAATSADIVIIYRYQTAVSCR